MLILGEKEAEMENVSVRKHRKGDLGAMSPENFVELIKEEISESISKFEN
jgi:threonyl-tRNA synthetase